MAMVRRGTWIIFGVMAVVIRGGLAIDVTCGACSDACCQWAFAAHLAAVNGVPSLEMHSRRTFERYGFDPVPCRDALGDEQAYYRCAERAFFRCRNQKCCQFTARRRGSLGDLLKPSQAVDTVQLYESLNAQLRKIRFSEKRRERSNRGVSGVEQVRFYPGQVIVLQKVNGKWEVVSD